MDRRTFVGALAAGISTSALGVAPPRGRVVHVIGLLSLSWLGAGPSSPPAALQRRLAELGWIEGRNIAFVMRSAQEKWDRLPALAAELVAIDVEVILTLGSPATSAAKTATSRIPIVMAGTDNPVADGLIASLAKPGGNVTGLANNPGPSFYQKILQVLKEAAPAASRVGVLRNQDGSKRNLAQLQAAAPTLNLTVVDIDVREADQMPRALASAVKGGVDALYVFPDYLNGSQTELIVDFARANRLPSIGGNKFFVQAGGLLSYWADWNELVRRSAGYVDKILRGADPAVLPVEQPDKFELVINPETAKKIGLTIPPLLLQRADEIVR